MNAFTNSHSSRILYLLMAWFVSLLLMGCQGDTWSVQRINLDGYTIEAQFPAEAIVLERPYHLFEQQSEEPMTMVQWFAADGESSFNLSYLLVPGHLEPAVVAKELLRSMSLKRDPRLSSAPTQFQAEYEQDLPALGEQFKVSVGADSKHLVARAKVIQEGRLIVQLYTAGPEAEKNFLRQSQRFFDELKIGATID